MISTLSKSNMILIFPELTSHPTISISSEEFISIRPSISNMCILSCSLILIDMRAFIYCRKKNVLAPFPILLISLPTPETVSPQPLNIMPVASTNKIKITFFMRLDLSRKEKAISFCEKYGFLR